MHSALSTGLVKAAFDFNLSFATSFEADVAIGSGEGGEGGGGEGEDGGEDVAARVAARAARAVPPLPFQWRRVAMRMAHWWTTSGSASQAAHSLPS